MHNYGDNASTHVLESKDSDSWIQIPLRFTDFVVRNQKCCVSFSIDVRKLYPPAMKMMQLKNDISLHAFGYYVVFLRQL